MKEMIRWLKETEHLASELYMQAASFYTHDPKFKNFLEDIAEDEALHYQIMESAEEYFSLKPAPTPAISIDKDIKDKITKYFIDLKIDLENNTVYRDELIERIVEAELSEWNNIFYYVVNVLKEHSSEFKYSAAILQKHIRGIEKFLEIIDNHPEILKKIAVLPPVWIENILVVDDEEIITDLIKALLNRNRAGNIDVAHNGQEALKLIEDKFYKLIISDIDMPIMDGISLYKEVVVKFPTSKNRFLFITGDLSHEKHNFFNENKVEYLLKPMNINALREVASKIILSNSIE